MGDELGRVHAAGRRSHHDAQRRPGVGAAAAAGADPCGDRADLQDAGGEDEGAGGGEQAGGRHSRSRFAGMAELRAGEREGGRPRPVSAGLQVQRMGAAGRAGARWSWGRRTWRRGRACWRGATCRAGSRRRWACRWRGRRSASARCCRRCRPTCSIGRRSSATPTCIEVDSYDDFKQQIEEPGGFLLAHWDGTRETEDRIANETKATIRCIPFDRKKEAGKCMVTGQPSEGRVVFAKAY